MTIDNYELARRIRIIKDNGAGNKVLSDDGTYKDIAIEDPSTIPYTENGVTNVDEALNKLFDTLSAIPSNFVAGQNIKVTTNGNEVIIDLNGDIDCGSF